MQTHFVAYKNSKIYFEKFGTGPSALLCLHGFGENGKSFVVVENALKEEYTLLSVDLPFHGNTLWNENHAMEPSEFILIVEKIFGEAGFKNNIPFSLLGYSMGGRIGLELLQQVPQRIERIVLIAPDGLHINFWYWLGTQTWLGSKIFYVTMQNPNWFFTIVNIASGLRVLSKSVIKFIHYYLDDKRERELLYNRWMTMRKFKPQVLSIRKIVAENNVPVHFIFGSYDRIILSKRSDILKKDLSNVIVTVVEDGHQLLKQKNVDTIAKQFSQ